MDKITNTTRLVQLNEAGEVINYPVYMATVRAQHHDWSFAETPDAELIKTLGYMKVHDTDRPVVDAHVAEGVPEFDGEKWVVTWVVTEFTPEELAARFNELRADYQRMLVEAEAVALERGFPYEFDDGPGLVQIRNSDRANLNAARARAVSRIEAGDDTPMAIFNESQDEMHTVSPQQMVELADMAYDKHLEVQTWRMRLKNQITKALSVTDLPDLPIEFTFDN